MILGPFRWDMATLMKAMDRQIQKQDNTETSGLTGALKFTKKLKVRIIFSKNSTGTYSDENVSCTEGNKEAKEALRR